MHLLIPFAAPLPPREGAAPGWPALPLLESLLRHVDSTWRDEGHELSQSPPHERALARAMAWSGDDGCLPWAAMQAEVDGLHTGDRAWGLVTPAHWHVGTDQVSLVDPDALQLDDAASRQLFDSVRDLFNGIGFELHYGAPLRWYAAHPSLERLPCASLDRVIGRNVDRWLSSDSASRQVRRLQSEVQMLLHAHPANAGREASGLLPVNSFWLSGCGVAQAPRGPLPTVDARLRGPALAEDWPAWARAWQELDRGPIARLLALARGGRGGGGFRLTLCGERSAATFEPARRAAWRAAWRRVRRIGAKPAVPSLLGSL